MNIRTITAGMAVTLFSATSLWGAAPSAKQFPPVYLPQQESKAAKAPQKAPLNKERALGTKIFGVTSIDYYIDRHFVNLYSNRTYDMEHLAAVQTPEEYENARGLHMVNAGAWAGYPENKYYAYKVKYFTIGITYSDSWLEVDPETGSWTKITDLPNDAHDYTYLYDMSWNTVEEQMYGLIQSTEEVKSRLGIVNLKDSSIETWVDLPDYYFCIAFDYDGMLYGIRWKANSAGNIVGAMLDRFDEDYEVIDSRELKVNGNPYLIYYQNGLDFDHTTGDLWWTACNTEGQQSLVKINPDTAETERCGSVGFNECVLGLHIPFMTAEDREAPAQVKGLDFEKCADGSNTVTIKWTNPVTKWNRETLDELTDIAIWRDSFEGEPMAVLTAEGTGAEQSYVDSEAGQGVHKYYVCARNAKGRGVPAAVEAFVGRDVPGPVRDLQAIASADGKSATIQWRKPNNGASDGWFDDTELTYRIVRNPGNVVLAENLTKRNYVDEGIPEARLYTYTVTPSNIDGEGTPADTEPVLVGDALAVPFQSDLSSEIDGNRFTSFDQFGYKGYEYDPFTSSLTNEFQKTTNDMTLATPPIKVEMGKTYRVDWKFDVTHFNYAVMDMLYHFQITGGDSATPDAMKDVIADFPDLLSSYSGQMFTLTAYFTADHTGEYHIGLRNLTAFDESDARRRYNYEINHVKSFTMQEAPDGDLGVESFETRLALSNIEPNVFEVEVVNNGTTDISDYDVEVGLIGLDGVFRKIGSLAAGTELPVLKARTVTPVKVYGYENVRDLQEVAVRTVVAGDGNSYNDMSEGVIVDFSAIYPLNLRFDKGEEAEATYVPIMPYTAGSVTQTIYDKDLIEFIPSEGVDAPVIRSIGWHYTGDKDVMGNAVRIYLGQTSKTKFNDKTFVTGHTLVYEGTLDFFMGEHFIALNLDRPYTLDPNSNLVVTVEKYQTANVGEFPIHFVATRPFGYEEGGYPSIVSQSSSPVSYSDPTAGKVVTYYESPVLYLGGDGFQPNGGSGLIGTLATTSDEAPVYYDLNGMRVNPTRLLPGVYVRVQNGRSEKVIIR